MHRRPCLDELHPPIHILVSCLFSFLLRSHKLPDYHHPFAFQDCLNAFIHFLKSLKTYGVDPSRVVVCGKSIGGTAAAVIIQTLLSRKDLPQFWAQVLIYAILLAINLQLPSHLQNQNVPFLIRDLMIICFLKYPAIDTSWKDAIWTGIYIPQDTWMKYRKWLPSGNIPQRFRNKIQDLSFLDLLTSLPISKSNTF